MNPYSMFHPNLTMGKCSKSRGNVRRVGGIRGGWGAIEKNFKRQRHEYVIGFHPNRIMGKYSKLGVRVWGEQKEFGRGGIISEKNANVTNGIPKTSLCRKFYPDWGWDSVQNYREVLGGRR